MRYVLIVLLLLASSIYASEINWAKDLHEGIETSRSKSKPIFFIVSNKNCPPCRYLATKTFKDKNIIDYLNQNFVSVVSYIDFYNPKLNDYVPRNLYPRGTPTLWFLNQDAEPFVQALVGARDSRKFLQELMLIKAEFDKAARRDNK